MNQKQQGVIRRPAWIFEGVKTNEELNLVKTAFGRGATREQFKQRLQNLKEIFNGKSNLLS